MAKDSQHFPVIIIGGGPAGLATSLTLSARGVHHCLIDANAAVTHKPGEAIPPNAKPLLRQLGVDHLLDHPHHIPYYGNQASWADSKLRQEEFISDIHGHGYLLDRLLFENQLREMVESPFCHALWGYRLRSVQKSDSEVLLQVESDDKTLSLRCTFIVDATGRKASVCRHLGVKKTNLDDQFAITLKVPATTSIEQQIHIEAVENGWWYAVPINSEVINLMFFTLKDMVPSKADLPQFLQQELKKTSHIQLLTQEIPRLAKDIKVMPAGTSCLDVPYGENWLSVGDAAYAYDPISSYGITSGLGAGYYSGHALADTLAGKEGAFDVYRYLMENAFQAYLEKLEQHYSLETRWPDSTYWGQRMSTSAYNELIAKASEKDSV